RSQLAQVREATRLAGLLPGMSEDRKEDRREYRNDCDHDKKLNEREGVPSGWFCGQNGGTGVACHRSLPPGIILPCNAAPRGAARSQPVTFTSLAYLLSNYSRGFLGMATMVSGPIRGLK